MGPNTTPEDQQSAEYPQSVRADPAGSSRPSTLFQIALWAGLLLGTFAIAVWGFISSPGGKPLSAQAQLEPGRKLVWKTGYPRIGGGITLGNAKPASLSAKGFAFHGWGQSRFVFNIFTAMPLPGAIVEESGVATRRFKDQVNMDAKDPVDLRILFYKGATWRLFERGNATATMASFASLSEEPVMHGMVDMRGKAGSRFVLTTTGCTRCEGSFADFNGVIYLTDPPKYGGPGADGITRIIIDSKLDPDRGFDLPLTNTRGFALFAIQPTEFHVDEYAEEVTLPANRGLLNFNNQAFALNSSMPLRIKFSSVNPARIEISSGSMADIRIDGVADRVWLGDEDLTPRRIDGWPWYYQVLGGAVIAFCAERLFHLLAPLDFSWAFGRRRRRIANSN